jgi:hypothetical protein
MSPPHTCFTETKPALQASAGSTKASPAATSTFASALNDFLCHSQIHIECGAYQALQLLS